MRWTPWSFLGGVGGDESPRWGHSARMRSGGSGGEGSLPNSFGWEFILFIKTHFYGEHSHHISWRSTHFLHLNFLFSWCRHQMETCSASLAFVRGIHRWLRGIHWSPVNSPHPDQWRGALMFSLICAWTNGSVKNQDAGDLGRHRAHYDVTVMRFRIVIQWSGQPWDLSAFNVSLLFNFELVKRVKLGASVNYGKEWPQIWHTAVPWFPFLEVNYILHSVAV